MLIPVSKVMSFGRQTAYFVYDSDKNSFYDFNLPPKYERRVLPLQDYMSCELSTRGIVTVVGRNRRADEYIISFGDAFLYSISRERLLQYTISNMKLTKNNRLSCKDGKLPDLGFLFPDRKIKFVSNITEIQASSTGLAPKFYGKYNGRYCVVKFSKTNGADLDNEITYKSLATILGVSCCNVIKSTYNGRPCCISFLKYNPKVDCFRSFKSLGLPLDEIFSGLSKSSRLAFDKLLLLDYLVNQQDRHMSNIALCNGELYPTFDNGECFNIGSIGVFSQRYRIYIERLDKDYLSSLLNLDWLRIMKLLSTKELSIFRSNYKNLFEG